MGGAGSVVAKGHGTKVADRHHAGSAEALKYWLRVRGDHVRVLGSIKVGDLYGLRYVAYQHERDKPSRISGEQGFDAFYELLARR